MPIEMTFGKTKENLHHVNTIKELEIEQHCSTYETEVTVPADQERLLTIETIVNNVEEEKDDSILDEDDEEMPRN